MKYLLTCLAAVALVACYDDEGNYDYRELDEVTITGIPEVVSPIAGAENITIAPTVVSKTEGEIKADNPDYEFAYFYNVGYTTEDGYIEPRLLDSARTKDIDILATLTPGDYKCWFAVKDKRTGLATTQDFALSIGNATSKGWVVLCEEGADRKVRVDMVGEIADGRILVAKNVLPTLPESHRAIGLFHDPRFGYASGPYLYVFTGEGGYSLNLYGGAFSTGEGYNLSYSFGESSVNHVIESFNKLTYSLVVDDQGDARFQGTSYGAVFGFPLNSLEYGKSSAYKVSKYVGTPVGTYTYNAVLYDITNKRFMSYYIYKNPTILSEILNPESQLFDWTTGNDLIYMEGCENNNVYALAKNAAGQLYFYGIQMVSYSTNCNQTLYRDAVSAPHLSEATCFAFHPNLPYLFYNYGNEVWVYNYSTNEAKVAVELDGAEKVTLLKFNRLIDYSWMSQYIGPVQEYKDTLPYRLIVGSSDEQGEDGSNGILRFYEVPATSGNLTPYGDAYTGFGTIRDVVYREN